MKLSIVIPVYYNEENLFSLYADIKEKIIDKINYEYEIVMVNDGSRDQSWEIMRGKASLVSSVYPEILVPMRPYYADYAIARVIVPLSKRQIYRNLRNLFLKWLNLGKKAIMWFWQSEKEDRSPQNRPFLPIFIIHWCENVHYPICPKGDLTFIW